MQTSKLVSDPENAEILTFKIDRGEQYIEDE